MHIINRNAYNKEECGFFKREHKGKKRYISSAKAVLGKNPAADYFLPFVSLLAFYAMAGNAFVSIGDIHSIGCFIYKRAACRF